jgi:hypothetical protein
MNADEEIDALTRALGALVIAAGQIELRVPLLAGALLGLTEQRVGIYLFGRQNTSRGLEVIADALNVTADCEAKSQAASWARRVKAAYKARSGVIHGTFGHDADGRLGRASLARGLTGPAVETANVDISEINAVTGDLVALTDEFDQQLCGILIRDLPGCRPMLGHPPA